MLDPNICNTVFSNTHSGLEVFRPKSCIQFSFLIAYYTCCLSCSLDIQGKVCKLWSSSGSKTNRKFACCFICVWNLFCYRKGRIYIEGIWEQNAEGNISEEEAGGWIKLHEDFHSSYSSTVQWCSEERDLQLYAYLTRHEMEASGQLHVPAASPPG